MSLSVVIDDLGHVLYSKCLTIFSIMYLLQHFWWINY